MNAELTYNRDSPLTNGRNPMRISDSESEHQDQELGSRNITWTLTCSGAKVHPKAYEKLKSEINWVEMS